MTRTATRDGRAGDGAPVALAVNYGSLRGLLPIAVLPIPCRGPNHLIGQDSVSGSDSVNIDLSLNTSSVAFCSRKEAVCSDYPLLTGFREMVEPVTPHAIDLVEVAYDVEKSDADWLQRLLESGAPILDHGLGIVATRFERPPHGAGADLVLRDVHAKSLPTGMWARLEAARSVLSADAVRALTSAGHAGTWTEVAQDYEDCQLFLDKLGCPDMLGLVASDPRGVGIHLSAPLPEATRLTARSRLRWQMLGAHISAAHRLRGALADKSGRLRAEATDLPCGSEAVLDPKDFGIVDSVGRAQEPTASEILRRAARRVDKARGKLRREDPRKALEMWKALVHGRWSVIDWFDTDGRRFVLARPNPPKVYDPRGLSEQECQVITYVLLGEANKLIAYRLGLSQGRVSGLLKSAMHKLGAKSKAQLVQKLGPLGVPTAAA